MVVGDFRLEEREEIFSFLKFGEKLTEFLQNQKLYWLSLAFVLQKNIFIGP